MAAISTEIRSDRAGWTFASLNRHGVALASAAALLLAACGGGSSTAASDDDGGDDSADSVIAEYESPLGDFLGWTNDFSDPDTQARFAAEDREREQEVAECMVAQGFEYTPVDNSQFINFDDADEFGGAEWGSEAWSKKYGFGITTLRFSQDAVGPNLVGNTWNDFGPEEDGGPTDPNQAYVESLDESTQQAYFAALYGNEPDIDFENATEEEINEAYENWIPDGCANQGFDEGADYQKFDEEFGSLLEDMGERIESDPRIVEETQRIKDCVTEKGETYRELDEELYEYFEEKMRPITAEQDEYFNNFDPFEGVDFESMTPEEQDEFFAENESTFSEPELSEASKTLLGELQAEEIGLATILSECNGGGGQFGETAVQAEVRKEYEQQFLDEHADKLAAFEGTFG